MLYRKQDYNTMRCARCRMPVGFTRAKEWPQAVCGKPSCYELGPLPTAARNEAIREAWAKGMTTAKIADDFGLSRQRVAQIVQADVKKARAIVDAYPRRRGRPPAEVVWARGVLERLT